MTKENKKIKNYKNRINIIIDANTINIYYYSITAVVWRDPGTTVKRNRKTNSSIY